MALDDPGPFRVRIYDKAFGFKFPLGDASVSVTPRHLAQPTATITIPLLHLRADAMFTPGHRATIDYLIGEDRNDDASWLRITSGQLFSKTIPEATTPAAGKVVTFGVRDDWCVMAMLLGWPNPASGIGSQSTSAYDVRSGPAETVIKAYMAANAGRLPFSLTNATNLARGATVYGSVRFKPLADVLPDLAFAGGLGITVDQVGSGLVLDCYVPTDRSARVLSESAGSLTSWSLATSGPSATAAIVASDGQGTGRHFAQYLDTATEAAWGIRSEAFVDARDLTSAQTSELAQRGRSALDDGAPQAGWSVTVAETDVVKYGRNLFVGDLVAVQITPTLALVDVLSECTLTWSTDSGLTVAPKVGASSSQAAPNRLLAKAVASVAKGLRTLRSGL